MEKDIVNDRTLQPPPQFINFVQIGAVRRQKSQMKSGVLVQHILQRHVMPVSIVVHDHETAIYHFGTGHAECNVHILRYLTKNSEDTGNTWSEAMKKCLCGMNRDRKRRIAANRPYTDDELSVMEAQYTAILKQGMAENKVTRPKWASKAAEKIRKKADERPQNIAIRHPNVYNGRVISRKKVAP